MSKERLKKREVIIQQQECISEASANLRKIQEKIKRFVKPRKFKFKRYSTAGKWVDGRLYRDRLE